MARLLETPVSVIRDNSPHGVLCIVVSDYGDHKMVEISNDRGETLDLPVVPVEQLKLIAKHG